MKNFKGKAIYNPSGKAGEYSYWACNFYVGCSNGCTYCYLRKGIGKAVLGGDHPTLKKCFKDEKDALQIFKKELLANIDELRKHGIFFTFTSDPMLPETISLTFDAIDICLKHNIPVKVLTKQSDWWNMWYSRANIFVDKQHLVAFGFTLTGHDELEPNASTNMKRLSAMAKLHKAGFKTWASIEPIIDIPSSLAMINLSHGFCDLYKIGLESGRRYPKLDIEIFVEMVNTMYSDCLIYFKDTLLKQAGIERSDLPSNCVDRDYNIFKTN
nr:radical SAM protein [uncultured Bacteroides sp.]